MASAARMALWLLTVRAAPLHASLHSSPGGRHEVRMEAGEALGAVLEAASLPHCSLLLLTDGNASQHALHQKLGALGDSWGLGVFEVALDHRDSNSTTRQLSRIVSHARRLRLLAWCVTVVVASEDPAFFAAFAGASDTGRLMVWATRLLAVTAGGVPVSEVKRLMRQHWTLSMMNAMFLAISATPGAVRCGLYSHLPYGPGGAQVVRVASWTPARGLVLNARHHKLFPDKYDNFHGSPVNMTVFPFSPYWMDVERSGPAGTATNTVRRTGRDYTILQTIAAALNFTINVLPYGEWDEVMFRLEQRVALMSPIKLAIMPHLLEIYDFTFLIEPATLGFSMAKPTLKPRWQSLYYPLKDEVWASILAALLLVPIALFLVSYAGEGRVADRRFGAWPVAEVVLGSLLAQTVPTRRLPGTTSTRVLVAAWLVFAFVVGKAYRGNLTAFLTVPKYPARPETLKQLIAAGALVTMPPDLVDFYNSFKKSDSIDYKTLTERSEFVPSFEVGMRESIENNKAYVYERLFMELMITEHFTDGDGSTPLYVARQNIMPGYCGWPLTRDAPFKVNLDRYIMTFHGAGLIGKWTKDILKTARTESLARQRMSKDQGNLGTAEEQTGGGGGGATATTALTIIHMQGPLLLLAIGHLLSAAAFGLEVSAVRCARRKNGAPPLAP